MRVTYHSRFAPRRLLVLVGIVLVWEYEGIAYKVVEHTTRVHIRRRLDLDMIKYVFGAKVFRIPVGNYHLPVARPVPSYKEHYPTNPIGKMVRGQYISLS